MRAFIIPGAVLLVAAVAVGCDQGTPTSPDVTVQSPQFRRAPPSPCPRSFLEKTLAEAAVIAASADPAALNDPNDVDGNGDGFVCVGTRAGQTFFTDNNVGDVHEQ